MNNQDIALILKANSSLVAISGPGVDSLTIDFGNNPDVEAITKALEDAYEKGHADGQSGDARDGDSVMTRLTPRDIKTLRDAAACATKGLPRSWKGIDKVKDYEYEQMPGAPTATCTYKVPRKR